MKKLNPKQSHYPKILKEAIANEKDVCYDVFLQSKDICHSNKIFVSFDCLYCGEHQRRSFKSLNKRERIEEPLCPKCVMKAVGKNKGWLKANSDAQKIAQNKPGQKKKNAEGVSKFWRNNPEKKRRMRENVKKAYENPEVKKRHMKSLNQSSSYSGMFKWRNDKIKFESGLELLFLISQENNLKCSIIRRCLLCVEYKTPDDRIHGYNPDFVMVIGESENTIVEVKSDFIAQLKPEQFKLKKKSCQEYVQRSKEYSEFKIVNEKWLEKAGVDTSKKNIESAIKRLYVEKRITNINKKIQKLVGK